MVELNKTQEVVEQPTETLSETMSVEEQTQTEIREPKCLQSFNWGAFFITFLWGIFNRVWWVLLCIIPIVNIIVMFYMGFKGNQLSWEHYKDEMLPEDFDSKQHGWNIAGWIILGLNLIYVVVIAIAGA